MKIRIVQAVLMLGATWLVAPATAQTPAQDVTAAMQGRLSAQVLEGCSSELTQHCAEVTPGEGRLLACLYAHGDKLSGQCELRSTTPPRGSSARSARSPTSPASAARTSRSIVPMWKWVKAASRSA